MNDVYSCFDKGPTTISFPGSLFSASLGRREAEKRDPGNEVGSTTAKKAHAIMPIGIMGSNSLVLHVLGRGSRCHGVTVSRCHGVTVLSRKEREGMNTRVCAASFSNAEIPWTSIKCKTIVTLIIRFDVVAFT